ncbi:putative export ATP-binding/permease protein [Pseudolycoriella hygida]|uniref:Export ATP-binding/permease protein n=1 Tax=Pseudolycoriella hygida TaxID=35572 RepID=A0A9Q0S471_9DIPT|nr:putative export ATP-binding/permease protein [Pseudolycoriella hygida]
MLKTNSICEARTFGLQQLLPVFFPFSTTAKNQEDNNNNSLAFIEFKNVSFSYPSRLGSIIFNNLSFQIGKGQFIGIAGRSGAGKSTIMQLLLKFYSLSEGEIKIMGQDISKIDTQQIRRLIGYIPQDPSIFSGTIRSNIAFVKPDATEQELINAADVTGIMDFAKNLTAGLDTEIGERGVRLSGGQKQKIAISRAILYNPEILLLDEAMSALDSENEQKLLKKLREVMKDKTILSIAHRISSIEQANEILVIDHGQVIARDTHKNLVKNCNLKEEHDYCKNDQGNNKKISVKKAIHKLKEQTNKSKLEEAYYLLHILDKQQPEEEIQKIYPPEEVGWALDMVGTYNSVVVKFENKDKVDKLLDIVGKESAFPSGDC